MVFLCSNSEGGLASINCWAACGWSAVVVSDVTGGLSGARSAIPNGWRYWGGLAALEPPPGEQ